MGEMSPEIEAFLEGLAARIEPWFSRRSEGFHEALLRLLRDAFREGTNFADAHCIGSATKVPPGATPPPVKRTCPRCQAKFFDDDNSLCPACDRSTLRRSQAAARADGPEQVFAMRMAEQETLAAAAFSKAFHATTEDLIAGAFGRPGCPDCGHVLHVGTADGSICWCGCTSALSPAERAYVESTTIAKIHGRGDSVENPPAKPSAQVPENTGPGDPPSEAPKTDPISPTDEHRRRAIWAGATDPATIEAGARALAEMEAATAPWPELAGPTARTVAAAARALIAGMCNVPGRLVCDLPAGHTGNHEVSYGARFLDWTGPADDSPRLLERGGDSIVTVHCGPRMWIQGKKCCPDCKHTEASDRTISRCHSCGYPGDTNEVPPPPAPPPQPIDAEAAAPCCARCCAAGLRACVAEALLHDHLGYWKNGHYTRGVRERFQRAVDRPICADRDCSCLTSGAAHER